MKKWDCQESAFHGQKNNMITKFIKSMGYALKGICLGIKEERNMRIDIVAMLFIWSVIPFYNFTKGETAIIVLITFIIPAFELMNTAIERAVHKPDAEHWMPAGDAKDTAAGAVFIAATGAVAVAAIMLFDIAVIKQIIAFYTSDITHILFAVAFVAVSYLFIIMDLFKKKEK